MTYIEAAKAGIGANYPWTDQTYVLGLLSSGLDDPQEEMVPGKTFDLALANLILYLITAADIQEGGYAVSLDRRAMLDVRRTLLAKWGMTDTSGPYLVDRTNRW